MQVNQKQMNCIIRNKEKPSEIQSREDPLGRQSLLFGSFASSRIPFVACMSCSFFCFAWIEFRSEK